MEFKDRLHERMQVLGIKAAEIARLTKTSKGAVSQWVNGIAKPSGEKLLSLAKVLVCQPNWLLSGENSQKQLPDSNAMLIGGIEEWDESTELADHEVEIPFLSEVELSAGPGKYSIENSSNRKLRFEKISLRKCGVEAGNALCVHVNGNSMEPVLPNRSTVGVDTACTRIIDGEIYAVAHGDMLRVKLASRLSNGGVRFRSYNASEYPDEVYTLSDMKNIRIIGRIFWYSVLKYSV